MAIKDYFSLNAWGPTLKGSAGDFWLIRADAGWCHAETGEYDIPGWFSVSLGLLGLAACITYWPARKQELLEDGE